MGAHIPATHLEVAHGSGRIVAAPRFEAIGVDIEARRGSSTPPELAAKTPKRQKRERKREIWGCFLSTRSVVETASQRRRWVQPGCIGLDGVGCKPGTWVTN